MGGLAFHLGNTYLHDGWITHNGSPEFLLLYGAQTTCVSDGAEPNLRRVENHIHRELKSLRAARMDRPDADLIKAEFANNARMALFGCQRGGAIISGKIKEAKTRRALAAQMRAIIKEHRRLWLARNREGGLQESLSLLEQRLSECA